MRYKIFGWTKAIMKDINSETKIIQKQWHKLTEVSRAVNI